MNRRPIFAAIMLFSVTLGLAACGTTRKALTVDQIQGVVNSIEGKLRSMRKALKAADGEKAAEHYAAAIELRTENKEALASYPERHELERLVEQSEGDLCYGQVSLAIRAYFKSIRAKARDEAKENLDRARSEYERCEPIIKDRDDFMPLKMNMDSAPQALSDLDKQLFRPKRLAQIRSVMGQLKGELASLRKTFQSLEAAPNQPTVAAQVDADIGKIREGLRLNKAYEDETVWTQFAAATQGELSEMAGKREKLVRRGNLLMTASAVSAADLILKGASRQKDRAKAAEGVAKAKQTYADCAARVDELVKQEKGLAKYRFPVKGAKHRPAWLKKHCRRSVRLADTLYARLLGKKAPAVKKPEKWPKKNPEKKDGAKKKKKKKKKRKRRRRRDIQRW